MKVTKVGGAQDIGSAKRKSKAADGDAGSFADELRAAQGAGGGAAASEAAAVSMADAVLAAQNVGDAADDAPRRRRLAEFADDVLGRLDELRLGILTGRYSKERLAELAQLLRQKRQQSSDPGLNEIIQEIELRAEVEIAKYSRRPKNDCL